MDNIPVKTLRHHSYAAALRQLTPLVLGPFHCEIWRQGEKSSEGRIINTQ